jgi:hypothetical protein
VEEVLASRQENPDAVLNSIRYADGRVGFFSRNHFMEGMWIPNAQKLGIITPIIMPGAVESLIEIDLAAWYGDNPEIIVKDAEYNLQANSQERFTASIPYMPIDQITEELLSKLPEETIVFFLKRYAKTRYRWLLNENAVIITHMGFLFGGCRIYHASSTQKRVTMEDFSKYVRANYGICGAAFYEITDHEFQ